MIGIYKLIDLKGRLYVGSSKNINNRAKLHFRELRKNKHDNPKLQSYYNKYGVDSLQLQLVEACEEKELLEKEQYYIDTLKPHFNICLKAGKPPSALGRKHKPETIAKIKAVRWKQTPETLAKLKWLRENTDMNKRRSESLKKTYAITGGNNLGKKHKPDFGQRMAVILKGRKFSDETIEKMRLAQKGRKASAEAKNKMSVAQTGRRHPPEAIENMKIAAKKRFENPEYRAKQLSHLKRLSEAKRKKCL